MSTFFKNIERRLRHSLRPSAHGPKSFHSPRRALQRLESRSRTQDILLGSLHAERVRALPDRVPITQAEFRVYSQWGEDGIVQYLVSKIGEIPRTFVEFGVEDYQESNTRFLLEKDDWAGLVLDGDAGNVDSIRAMPTYWRHDLQAIHAFITAENINDLIRGAGFSGEIGLLSIDVDGNDYWIWRAMEAVSPAIVVCEYNSLFGPLLALTSPYDPAFERTRAHFSNQYWGASLRALCDLAASKTYRFVGCNSAGVNAFFVRSDLASRLPAPEPAEAFALSRFRDSRDASGNLNSLRGVERNKAIEHLQVLDLDSSKLRRLSDLQLFPR